MGEHLAHDGSSLLDPNHRLYEINTRTYIKRRIQFWKYRKHHTMGRPILRLRNPLEDEL